MGAETVPEDGEEEESTMRKRSHILVTVLNNEGHFFQSGLESVALESENRSRV